MSPDAPLTSEFQSADPEQLARAKDDPDFKRMPEVVPYGADTSGGQGKEDEWARPLPPRPPQLLPLLDDTTATALATTLVDERILILVGDDAALLQSAAYDVVERPVFGPGWRKKYAASGLSVDNVIGSADGHSVLVLFSTVSSPDGRDAGFVASLNDISLAALGGDLRQREVLLLLLVRSRQVGNGGTLAGRSWHRVATVRHRARWLGVADPSDIERRVARLRSEGRWVQDGEHEAALLSGITSRDELEQLIQERERAGLPQPKGLEADPVSPLVLAAVYAATFFRDVSAEVFDRVARTVLAAERDADAEPGTDLLRRWTHGHPEAMRDAGLEFSVDSTLGVVAAGRSLARVRFQPADRAHATRAAFLARWLLLHQRYTEHLCRAGLLFHEDEALAGGVAENLVEVAARNPDLRGRGWILELVRLAQGPGVPAPEPTRPAATVVRELIEAIDATVRERIFDRLRLLLSCMLARDDLRDLVKDTLETLLSHPALRGALSRIAWQLRSDPRFDSVTWLRRVIDNGDAESGQKAYQVLRRMALGRESATVLAAAARWLPAGPMQAHAVARPGTSGRAAADLVVAVAEASVRDPHRGTDGRWPPDGALMAAFDKDGGELVGTFVRALFHPAVDNQLALDAHAHLSGNVEFRLFPPSLRDVVGADRAAELLRDLERRWIRTLLHSPRAPEDPLPGRGLPQALILLDWMQVLHRPDGPASAPLDALGERIATAIATSVAPPSARLLDYWWLHVHDTLQFLFGAATGGPVLVVSGEHRAAVRRCRRDQHRAASLRQKVRRIRLEVCGVG